MQGVEEVSADKSQIKGYIFSQPFRAVERKGDVSSVKGKSRQKAHESEKMVSVDMGDKNGTDL